jgi:hypothetical protein
MMSSSRTVHDLSQTRRRSNNLSMIHYALSSTANSWKSMLSERLHSKPNDSHTIGGMKEQ